MRQVTIRDLAGDGDHYAADRGFRTRSRASRACSSINSSIRRSRARWAACCTRWLCRPARPSKMMARKSAWRSVSPRHGAHRRRPAMERSAPAPAILFSSPACAASILGPTPWSKARRRACARPSANMARWRRFRRRCSSADCVRTVVYVTDMARHRPLANKSRRGIMGRGALSAAHDLEVESPQSRRFFRD